MTQRAGSFGAAVAVASWQLASVALAVGGTAMDGVNFVTGARAAGSGGTAAAAVVGPSALQWNPARLAAAPGWSGSLSHLAWVAGIRYNYAGLAFPLARGVLGLPLTGTGAVSLQHLDYGTIDETLGLAPAVEASDVALTAGAGFGLGTSLAAGGAVKWFHHALAGGGADEVAVDAGVAYSREAGGNEVTFAAVLQNLGFAGSLDGRRPPMPAALKAGVAYGFGSRQEFYVPWGGRTYTPALDLSYLLLGDLIAYEHKGPVNFRAGLEAGANGLLFLRAGYLQSFVAAGGNAGSSVGVGVALASLRVDYAYGWLGELGTAQYVTLSFAPVRAVPVEPAVTPEAERPSEARESKPPPDAYDDALAKYAAKDYGGARDGAQAVVAADPAHWRAWQLLGHARYALGDNPGALEAYRQSLAFNPENAELKAWMEQVSPH